jgi:exosortase B
MNTNSEIAKTGETVELAGTGESTESTVSQRNWQDLLLEWWPVLLGLVVLYYPTFRDLSNGVWQTDDQAHGPIILLVIGYLFYDNHKALYVEPGKRSPVLGGLAFVFGLLLFALGRSQEILVFELGALVWILGGVLLVSRGWQGIKAFWFPVMFCIFLIPLPGILVDALTGPLKGHISVLAENILYEVGYPISRDGVTIIIGQYQLLVADACSGLHSMFSLSALGLLYLYLMRYTNLARNGLMIVSILPISFAANVVRVIILILVTYHFGDEAGQGIIHGMAGMLLFVISLIFLFVFDSLLGRFPWFRDAAKVEVK